MGFHLLAYSTDVPKETEIIALTNKFFCVEKWRGCSLGLSEVVYQEQKQELNLARPFEK